MKIFSGLVLLGLSAPAFGQYAGPAILSRGEAPVAMADFDIRFRPEADVSAVYDSGLEGVSLNSQAQFVPVTSAGVRAGWRISGTHRWRHTSLGLDYRGSLTHYAQHTYYDSTDQSLLLGLTHHFSPHATLVLRESAGMFSRTYGASARLSEAVPFDPAASNIPVTDFFDNRTLYETAQADFSLQRSVRLSLNLGGDGFIVRRRSSALSGAIGGVGRGDLQYRLTRKTSIGVAYNYSHFEFTRAFGGSDSHSWKGVYSIRLSRLWEFSGYGGPTRVESKFIEQVAVDPVIAALLGISSSQRVTHVVSYIPNAGARLSRVFQHGFAYVSGGHDITPGNGLFLTTYATNALAGYTYTGRRRWSFSGTAVYSRGKAVGTIAGEYHESTQSLSFSRQLGQRVHLLGGVDLRQYGSGDFSGYNRNVYGLHLGLGFAPGDLPLRLR